MKNEIIFNKEYDNKSILNLEQDLADDFEFWHYDSPDTKTYSHGKFKVTIVWESDEDEDA